MKNAYFWATVTVIIIGTAAWWYTGGEVMSVVQKPAPDISRLYWGFEEAGEKDSVSQTKVSLKAGPVLYDLGTYPGTCFDMKGSSWKMDANEIAGAICWFAGGGHELGVFDENGRVTIKEGILDEGDEETGGYRGDFETIIEVK